MKFLTHLICCVHLVFSLLLLEPLLVESQAVPAMLLIVWSVDGRGHRFIDNKTWRVWSSLCFMGGSSPGLVEYDHIFFIAPKCSSDLGGGAAQELILCKTGGGLPQSCFQNHYIFAGGKIILLGGKFILAGLVTTQQSHPVRERKFLIPKKNQKRNLIHRFTNT